MPSITVTLNDTEQEEVLFALKLRRHQKRYDFGVSMKTKEQIYDEQIDPLMAQILNICKAHKIAMVASFAIPNDEDPELLCTSALLEDTHNPPREYLAAKSLIMQGFVAWAATTRPFPLAMATMRES